MKIPTDSEFNPLLDLETVKTYYDQVKSMLPEWYNLIASIVDIEKISGDCTIVKTGCKEYSYNELMEVIEKAEMYDSLCK